MSIKEGEKTLVRVPIVTYEWVPNWHVMSAEFMTLKANMKMIVL